MERPKNFKVKTVTNKEITLSESETQQLFAFIDMGMPQEFIQTWLHEVVAMYNADDRFSDETEDDEEEYTEFEEVNDDEQTSYMMYTILGIIGLVALTVIWNLM